MKSNQAALGLSENCSPRSFTAATSRFGVCKEGGGEMPHLPLPLIDVEALASTMRVAYETYKNDKQEWSRLQSLSKERAEDYTIERVGQTMKELLNV